MKLRERYIATRLRRKGYSLNEIAHKVRVSKGTLSLWLRDVSLPRKAKQRLEARLSKGQLRSRKILLDRGDARRKEARQNAVAVVSAFTSDKTTDMVLCALVYWCEGGKSSKSMVSFTNSDAQLIKAFLRLFRRSFGVDESKFRVCMHLHAYHNERTQKRFWSEVTGIPQGQFIKTYQKSNTGRRTRADYPGCINVRYYDTQVGRVLRGIAREYLSIHGRVR